MKVIKTIKTEQVEVFEFYANDGKRFETEEDCRKYELGLDKKMLQLRIEQIPKVEMNICLGQIEKITKFTIKTEEDAVALDAWFSSMTYEFDGIQDMKNSLKRKKQEENDDNATLTFCVVEENDYIYCTEHMLYVLQNIKNVLNEIEL